ncbi:MAG: hypothetical protein E5Y63_20600 [Mesorhizobium sp.]|nr:MAG: hypothetical protein E5Y63_20600 [Mesorhizobium sp.]
MPASAKDATQKPGRAPPPRPQRPGLGAGPVPGPAPPFSSGTGILVVTNPTCALRMAGVEPRSGSSFRARPNSRP